MHLKIILNYEADPRCSNCAALTLNKDCCVEMKHHFLFCISNIYRLKSSGSNNLFTHVNSGTGLALLGPISRVGLAEQILLYLMLLASALPSALGRQRNNNKKTSV